MSINQKTANRGIELFFAKGGGCTYTDRVGGDLAADDRSIESDRAMTDDELFAEVERLARPSQKPWMPRPAAAFSEALPGCVVGFAANGREIRRRTDGQYEVQPPTDNYWVSGNTPAGALVAAGWVKSAHG